MSNPNDPEQIRKRYPERLTRGKAIKLYCKLCCCAGDEKSWRDCHIKHCFLWAFRKGSEEILNKTKINSKTIASERLQENKAQGEHISEEVSK